MKKLMIISFALTLVLSATGSEQKVSLLAESAKLVKSRKPIYF